RNSSGKALTPSWLGGRLPLTSHLAHFLRKKLALGIHAKPSEKELQFLFPLFSKQLQHSHLHKEDEFLVENIHTREGLKLFIYTFVGRLVYEIMAIFVIFCTSQIYPRCEKIELN